MKKLFFVVLLIMLLVVPVQAAPLLPEVTPSMNNANYWVGNIYGAQNIILSREGVEGFNSAVEKTYASKGELALQDLNGQVSSVQVKNWMSQLDFYEDELYVNGRLMSDELKGILKKARNIENMPSKVTVRYGVTLRRADLRTFPTKLAAFESASEKSFDNFQETVIDPNMAVAILHESKNGMFYFVQADRYYGWVYKSDVGITKERNKWLRYVNPKNFLVVTDKNLIVNMPGEQLFFQMGSRLPLVAEGSNSYKVLIATADRLGNMQESEVNIPKNGVNKDYLTYTKVNIITQAFKFLGTPYGWGGLQKGVDCSSFLQNVYNSVGVRLPRNADVQAEIARGKVDMYDFADGVKKRRITTMPEGTALFTPNHVVIYLGNVGGEPYAIHALSRYSGGNVMQVVVSKVDLRLASGNSLLHSITSSNSFR